MRTDEHVEDSLRQAMHAETATLQAPAGLAESARRGAKRRTWVTRVCATAPAVLAAAALTAAVLSGNPAPPTGEAQARTTEQTQQARQSAPTTTGEQPQPVAYVVQHVSAAMQESTSVQYSIGYTGPRRVMYQKTWSDRTTRKYRSDNYSGKTVVSAVALTHDGTHEQYRTFVNYTQQTWFAGPYPADEDITALDVIRNGLESGQLTVVGKAKINGHDTLHLSMSFDDRRVQWWVDEVSYLPYRIENSSTSDPSDDTRLDIEWLPRTPENLAPLDLAVPAGFKRVKG